MNQLQNATGLFQDVASAIAAKYLAQVNMMAAKQGSRPSFDDLMVQLKQMEQELTKQGVAFLEENKPADSAVKEQLTSSLKEIIRHTIEAFVRQL